MPLHPAIGYTLCRLIEHERPLSDGKSLKLSNIIRNMSVGRGYGERGIVRKFRFTAT